VGGKGGEGQSACTWKGHVVSFDLDVKEKREKKRLGCAGKKRNTDRGVLPSLWEGKKKKKKKKEEKKKKTGKEGE